MKSNMVYGQSRKNPTVSQQDQSGGPSVNLHNFSSGKHQITKPLDDKSIQKMMGYQNKVQNKIKPKYDGKGNEFTKLKKQYNTIMNEAKIRKAYSPSCIEQKPPEDVSVETKPYERIISPQGTKKSSYKVKTKQEYQDKKKQNGIINEHDKKAPSWLHKKNKNEHIVNANKNSTNKYENDKSRQNKPEKSPKYSDLKNHNKSSARIHVQTTLGTTADHSQKNKQQTSGKEWKKCCESTKSKKVDEGLINSKSENPQFVIEMNISPEMDKIMFQKELNEVRRQLENALEDKNILINRIETLETELGSSNRKLQEWKQIEATYKANEKNLKDTISQLQDKLVTSRETKNRQLSSEIAKFHGQSSSQKEILAKKNEQISRLNEVLINNRNKVEKAYQQLSSQKLKLVKQKQIVEQKYEAIIASKDKQLENIKDDVQRLKEEVQKLQKQLDSRGNEFHRISLELQTRNKMMSASKEQDSTYVHSYERTFEGQIISGASLKRSSEHPKSKGEAATSNEI